MGKKSQKHKHRITSSSSSSDEYEWEPCKPATSTETKDTSDNVAFDELLGRVTSKKEPRRGSKTESAEPHSKLVELNPYWANEGAGLPENERTVAKSTKINAGNERWLARAYKRAEEESAETGMSVHSLLLDRWDEITVEAMEKRFGRLHGGHRQDNHPRWKQRSHEAASRSPINRKERREGQEIPGEKDYSVGRDTFIGNAPSETTSFVKQVEERYVTEADLNSAAALLMKAELMGNQDKVGKLQARLDKLREAQRRGLKVRLTRTLLSANSATSLRNTDDVVQLTCSDKYGREMPMHLGSSTTTSGSFHSKYEKIDSHDDKGNRINFLIEDCSSSTLEDLVRQERMESRNAPDMQFANMAGKCRRGPEDEYDDAFVSKKSVSKDVMMQRQKTNAVSDYKRKEFAQANCSNCLERIPRYLVMNVGQRMFLSLPEHVSLTRGHCLITPSEHVGAMTRVDDSAVEEAREMKRILCRMASVELHPSDGGSYVFLETAAYPNTFKYHVQIECIPVDKSTLQELPSYFKKALLDLGSEWDHNNNVLKLRQPGLGARNVVPENFGYFAVEFGDSGTGFAKVIEDWASFPSYFGREVVAGILEAASSKWRRPKRDSPEDLCRKAVDFEQCWASVNGQPVIESTTHNDGEPEGPCLPP